MNIRVRGLTLSVVIGTGLAVAACSSASTTAPAGSATRSASAAATSASPTASPVATSSPVPAGYTRVGGAAQGISIAAPASWVGVNLATETIKNAASKLNLKGISASTLVQDLESLQKQHAVIVYDVKSAVDSSRHFARNLNAYCVSSGVTDTGAAGVPFLKSGASAEFSQLGATHIAQQDLEIGGVPGIETSYQLSSPSAGTIDGSQIEVLPKPDKACFVTLTTAQGQSTDDILSVAAATAEFP